MKTSNDRTWEKLSPVCMRLSVMPKGEKCSVIRSLKDGSHCLKLWCQTSLPSWYTGVLISLQPDQDTDKLQGPNSNFCKPQKKKNQKVFRPTRSPQQQWSPRRTKNGDLSIVFFSRVGLRIYQHPCNYLAFLRCLISVCARTVALLRCHTVFLWSIQINNGDSVMAVCCSVICYRNFGGDFCLHV